MNNFHATVPLGENGEKPENFVWSKLKDCYGNDSSIVAYWRYPIFSKVGQLSKKEPDILIIGRELGIIVIEVKGFTIDSISSIQGHKWIMSNFYAEYIYPYKQALSYVNALRGRFFEYESLQKNVGFRAVVALPNIKRDDWREKGYESIVSSPNSILFKDDLENNLKEIITSFPYVVPVEHPLTKIQWKEILFVISGQELYDSDFGKNSNSKEEELQRVEKWMGEVDLKQDILAKEIPPGPQRIRGIAGSGKTVLLCQKAARMYISNPEMIIVLTFYTRSLYLQVEKLVDKWLRHFSNGSIYYDEKVREHIKIMHTWGSSDQEGFLRYMSEKYLRKTYELSDSRNYRYSLRVFAEICTIFLRELKEKAIEIVPEFDAVLIDEAQDLIVDIDDERDGELLLFEEKQSFFSMVWKSLKPSSDKDTNLRRLIWAYDEAQSLDALKIPMYKEVFGETLGKELSRGQFYKGGTKKSEIMYKCYRSPKEVLLLAHILGMGLFRSKGMLSGLTSQRDWENLGYDVVSGNFSKNGNIVRLHRPDENSPHVIRKKTNEKLVNYHLFDNRVDEVSFIADKVSSLVNDDQISPERILVVCFRRGKEKTLQKQVANAFKKKFLNFFIPTAKKQNYFPTDWKEKNKNNFFSEGATTISFVPRAKGNEADIVFLVGLDLIAEKENSVQKRNELFVGITRTRGWLFLSGLNNNYSLYTELAKGCQCKSDIEFRYVRPKRSLDEEPQLSLF